MINFVFKAKSIILARFCCQPRSQGREPGNKVVLLLAWGWQTVDQCPAISDGLYPFSLSPPQRFPLGTPNYKNDAIEKILKSQIGINWSNKASEFTAFEASVYGRRISLMEIAIV